MLNRMMKKALVAVLSGILVVSTVIVEELPVYATQLEDVTVSDGDTVVEEDTTVSGGDAEEEEDTTVSGGDAEVEEDTTVSGGDSVVEEDATVSDGDVESEDDETTDEEESTEDEKPFKKLRKWWKRFMKKLPFVDKLPKPIEKPMLPEIEVEGGDAEAEEEIGDADVETETGNE